MRGTSTLRHRTGFQLNIAVLFLLTVLWASCSSLLAQSNYYIQLKSFGLAHSNNAAAPQSPLIEGSDGSLYGTTRRSGTNALATLYRVNKDGTGFRVLHAFSDINGQPEETIGKLLEGSDGRLYGATRLGSYGSAGGRLFRINKDGSAFAVIHTFVERPNGGVTEGSDGCLYGACSGLGHEGFVFKIGRDGTDLQIVRSFDGEDGEPAYPVGPVVEGADGYLYGCSYIGGRKIESAQYGSGTVFRLSKEGECTILHSFDDYPMNPECIFQGQDGALYGRTANAVFKVLTNGTGYQVLHRLIGGLGGTHLSGVVQATNGLLIGTTLEGGTNNQGTIFAVATNGLNFRVVKEFDDRFTGRYPAAEVTVSQDGFFYGVTQGGGACDSGVVYAVSPEGDDYRAVTSFRNDGFAGGAPSGPLVQGTDGDLYGALRVGGQWGAGLLFKLSRGGQYSVIREFLGRSDGATPNGPLLEQGGWFYGTTEFGGTANLGTVFKVRKDGSGHSIVHHFTEASQGTHPIFGVVAGGDDFIYGVAASGGGTTNIWPEKGVGTVYKVRMDGSDFQVLHTFSGAWDDAARPVSLILSSEGILYGLTASHPGAVFSVRTNGTDYKILYSPENFSLGESTFLLGQDGKLYGTARAHRGIIYRMDADGTDFTVLHTFDRGHASSLVQTADGVLFGLLQSAYVTGGTALFQVHTNGSGYQMIPDPLFLLRGIWNGSLMMASDGNLYGTTPGGGARGIGNVFAYYRNGILRLVLEKVGSSSLAAQAPAGSQVQLLTSTNLTGHDWSVLDTGTADANGNLVFTNVPANGTNRFFRLLLP